MKVLFAVFVLWFYTSVNAQSFSGKLMNPLEKMPEMDIMIWPMGMDKAVNIGKLTAEGILEFHFPDQSIFLASNETNELLVNDFEYSLMFNCMGNSLIQYPDALTARLSPIGLWYKYRYVGVLFPVTDQALIPWLEDEAYNNPVKGTFYDIIYVSKPTSFLANCTTSLQFSSEKINANYEYDLELKLGLNFIAYTIESIYEFDPLITSYKPTKVKVTNVKDTNSDIQWIAKYF